jgi:hypothetical protein
MTIEERVKYALDTMGDMGRDSQERVLRAHFLAVAEQEREACENIAQQKVDKMKARLKDNPGEEGFAYSALTAADIRDAISKRARSNASDNEGKK